MSHLYCYGSSPGTAFATAAVNFTVKLFYTSSRITFSMAAIFFFTFLFFLEKEIQLTSFTVFRGSANSNDKNYVWMLLFFTLALVTVSVAIVFNWMYREEKLLPTTNTPKNISIV